MKTIFFTAAVLAILSKEINAAATGAVGNVKSSRVPNINCPNLGETGDAETDATINGTDGCMKLKCGAGSWIEEGSTHCLCCIVYNDPHVAMTGNPIGLVGTISFDFDFMRECEYALFFCHPGNVPADDLIPDGPSTNSVFAYFKRCDWAFTFPRAGSLTCIKSATFTCGPKTVSNSGRIQIKFTLLDATKDVDIMLLIGLGAPLSALASTITAGDFSKSADETKAVLFFPFSATTKRCVRCIHHRGMLAVCPNLVIIFFRPEDPLGGVSYFGLCGKWTDLPDTGKPVFEYPRNSSTADDFLNHDEYLLWADEYLADLQPECLGPLHNVTLTARGDSRKYIAASEETCQGYRSHVDVCTKTVNKYGRDLPEGTKQSSIRSCVTDMCGVSRGARNDEELQKGLNKWVEVAAEVAEARSIAG